MPLYKYHWIEMNWTELNYHCSFLRRSFKIPEHLTSERMRLTWEEMLLRRLLQAESKGSSLVMTSSSWPTSSRWEAELSWDLRCSRRSMGTDFLAFQVGKHRSEKHLGRHSNISHKLYCILIPVKTYVMYNAYVLHAILPMPVCLCENSVISRFICKWEPACHVWTWQNVCVCECLQSNPARCNSVLEHAANSGCQDPGLSP